MNPIALYMLAESGTRVLLMIHVSGNARLQTWIYHTFYNSWFSEINPSLVFALVYVVFWFGILAIFYKKRIFIKN